MPGCCYRLIRRGHKLSHYAKILQYAKTHQIRVVGLNVPIPVVQVGSAE
jgi:radical SAM superfamily enzyme